jgi:hypothetical protein
MPDVSQKLDIKCIAEETKSIEIIIPTANTGITRSKAYITDFYGSGKSGKNKSTIVDNSSTAYWLNNLSEKFNMEYTNTFFTGPIELSLPNDKSQNELKDIQNKLKINFNPKQAGM